VFSGIGGRVGLSVDVDVLRRELDVCFLKLKQLGIDLEVKQVDLDVKHVSVKMVGKNLL